MEHLDAVACRHLGRGQNLFATILGSGVAAVIALTLGAFLGYL